MFTLQIEHSIKDFDMWKAAFDRDPVNRAASGVVSHRIGRPVDDTHYVVVELDFAEARTGPAVAGKSQGHGVEFASRCSCPGRRAADKDRGIRRLRRSEGPQVYVRANRRAASVRSRWDGPVRRGGTPKP